MASGPITSWQIDEETTETVTDILFLGYKITSDNDCSHEIKSQLLLGRKAITNLDNTLKSRDITLTAKVHLVKDMVFPVVLYGCESWIIDKAKSWNQIDHIIGSHRQRSTIQSAKIRPGADCSSDHELLIAKFRFQLTKVRKITRPFRYDLNQILLRSYT